MHGSKNNSPQPLVLIAEDELLVALDLEETVKIAGYGVEGPFPSVKAAQEALDTVMPDCALLDVQLLDSEIFPVADRLRAANIPIIFHSGSATSKEIAARYPDAQLYTKPCPPDLLLTAIRGSVEEAAQA